MVARRHTFQFQNLWPYNLNLQILYFTDAKSTFISYQIRVTRILWFLYTAARRSKLMGQDDFTKADSSKHENETSESTKCSERTDKLINC
jgi:hypothetical protein